MNSEIQIRRYQASDVDAIYEAVIESKAELSIWMPWCHQNYSIQDTRTWVEGRADAWARNEDWSFLIVDHLSKVLGSCGIHRLDLKNGCGELGYWVRSSATGCGIASSATVQLCRWVFAETELERIEILAALGNTASQRVAEKAGANREAILRQRLRLNDGRHDCVLFAILKSEFACASHPV